MAALNLDAIDDFVLLTLENFKKNQYIDLSLDLQQYHFASRWFAAHKRAERGGPQLNFKLRVANQGTFKHSGLYAVDDTNRVNVMAEGKVNWSKNVANYIYDIDEDAFQSGPETIIREMVLNEQGLMNDFFEGMETAMWTSPASETVNPRPPAGIPAWLPKSASIGWTAGDGNFASGIGNILTATYAKWKSYGGTYANISRDDWVEKVITAMDYCNFKPPVAYPEIGGGDPTWGLYTVYTTIATLRRQLQAGNDNIGDNVAAHSGNVFVRSTPLIWVPALDNSESDAYDATNPIYGINWKKFHYFFKSGRNMLKLPPKQAARQSTVRERHLINWGNFVCYDRRQGGFVLYDSTV